MPPSLATDTPFTTLTSAMAQAGEVQGAVHDRSMPVRQSAAAAGVLSSLPCVSHAGLLEELGAVGYATKAPAGLGQAPHFEWVADCLLWLSQR